MNQRRFCRSVRPIEPGDYVQFAYLPKSMQVTPILVTAVAKNGLVELYGRGWFQPYLLMRVPPAKEQRRFGLMCEHLKLDRRNVIICGGRRKRQYCACGRPCDFLCDWKVPANESGTCDKPICAHHSKQVALGKHLCPEHQLQYDDWKRKHPPAQKSLFGEAA